MESRHKPKASIPPVAMTIAASDPLGGAGLQADLATFAAFGVHGTTAITAITAQTLAEVTAVEPVSAEMLREQIRSACSAAGFEPAAVKTGLLQRVCAIDLVASLVDDATLPAPVVDPVMVDGCGVLFVASEVVGAYRRRLFPLAAAITPNRAEAELLTGVELPDAEAVLRRADAMRQLGAAAVIVTGGGFDGPPDDVVITADDAWAVPGRRVPTANVRGSGCTFSAALASGLALGRSLREAVDDSSRFAHAAIAASASWPVEGAGPVAHTLPAARPTASARIARTHPGR